jgi:hypothetical protein
MKGKFEKTIKSANKYAEKDSLQVKSEVSTIKLNNCDYHMAPFKWKIVTWKLVNYAKLS